MKKTVCIFVFGIHVLLLSAQNDPGTNMYNAGKTNYTNSGETIYSQKFGKESEGSPFFINNWLKADFLLKGGKISRENAVKLDLLNFAIFYQDEQGNELACISKLDGINLYDTINNKNYYFIHASAMPDYPRGTLEGYYLRMRQGEVSLFKKIIKHLTDPGTQRSTLSELSVSTSAEYYVSINNTLFNITKIKEFPDVLPKNKELVTQYIKDHKLKGKREEDFTELVDYYNQLGN
ncbi:MAG: hypothetical protein GC171_02000 [Terrimonas sp.]|nr:hypothetical protein [Terrimonas sp.]